MDERGFGEAAEAEAPMAPTASCRAVGLGLLGHGERDHLGAPALGIGLRDSLSSPVHISVVI
jgi:hypothetical protein